MNTINAIVAANIKKLREKNKLSLDELAKTSSVSKSMLAQIERGDGNPTISTLWKIANGMGIPFDALTVRPENPYQIVQTAEIAPLLEDNGKVKNYSLFPDDENRRFAVYYLELETGSYWKSEPHLKGATEFITMFQSTIEIYTNEQKFVIGVGESLKFKADAVHSYRNIGKETAILHMIIYNP